MMKNIMVEMTIMGLIVLLIPIKGMEAVVHRPALSPFPSSFIS